MALRKETSEETSEHRNRQPSLLSGLQNRSAFVKSFFTFRQIPMWVLWTLIDYGLSATSCLLSVCY